MSVADPIESSLDFRRSRAPPERSRCPARRASPTARCCCGAGDRRHARARTARCGRRRPHARCARRARRARRPRHAQGGSSSCTARAAVSGRARVAVSRQRGHGVSSADRGARASRAAITSSPACRECTSGRSAISSTRCARSAPTSAISAQDGFPPLAIGPGPASGTGSPGARDGPRRRVEPVPVRVADGIAAAHRGIRTGHARRYRRRADFEAVRRHHARPDGLASASQSSTTTGAQFRVPAGGRYASPGSIDVEGDASTASYFLAAGALGGGPVRVTGVGRRLDPGRRRVCRRARANGRRSYGPATTGSKRRPAMRSTGMRSIAPPFPMRR